MRLLVWLDLAATALDIVVAEPCSPAAAPTLQAEAAAGVARPAEPAAAPAAAAARAGPTPEQVTAIKAAIAAASTLEEVRWGADADNKLGI